MVSKRITGRFDGDRDEEESIRLTGGRSLLRFVAPKKYIYIVLKLIKDN